MVGLAEIMQAKERLGDAIYCSPCARSEYFSKACNATTFFKLENLQMTGSFKERGALNRILTLSQEERDRGLVTASAGNHAQALAYHAGRQGIRATIVMPKRTPLIKVANTRSYGADVRLVGDTFDDAYQHARKLEAELDLTFAHPFDDPFVIAGQGTIALELMNQQPDLEVIIVPIGGGGLISGIAVAYKTLRPQVQIVGVQAAAVPAMKVSRESGKRVAVEAAQTIADGIAVKRPGKLTFKLVEKYVDEIVTVEEGEIANAVLLLLEREKTVAEGAGAAGLAALYHGHVPSAQGKKTAMVLCGGNIDVSLLSRIIERGLIEDGRLVRLDLKIQDRPGSLARLLQLVAEAEANVLEVFHQRGFSDLGLDEVDVHLNLETRGREHVTEIIETLADAGFRAREVRREV